MQAAARFAEYLAKHQLKMTRERREILDQVLSERGHFDVEDLLRIFRDANRMVSRATLYRTLAHLVEAGLVHKVEMAHGQARYEPMVGRHHHDHMVCLGCGSIIEFESRDIERLQDDVCRRKRFRMTGHTHQIRGYCSECVAQGRDLPGAPPGSDRSRRPASAQRTRDRRGAAQARGR